MTRSRHEIETKFHCCARLGMDPKQLDKALLGVAIMIALVIMRFI